MGNPRSLVDVPLLCSRVPVDFSRATLDREPFPNGCVESLAMGYQAGDLRSTPSSEDERCDGIEEGISSILKRPVCLDDCRQAQAGKKSGFNTFDAMENGRNPAGIFRHGEAMGKVAGSPHRTEYPIALSFCS